MERKNEQERDLYFSGDIHGEFKELVWKICQQYRIMDANVVILGDVGIGFGKPKYYNQIFKKLSPKLEQNNITLYLLAGNHDDRKYWEKEDLLEEHPRFIFLKDHETIELSGRTIYPIMGATSIDYKHRINYNELMERVGSEKRIWWPTEDIVKKFKDLPTKVDIIASHCAPLSFSPVITRYPEEEEEVYYRDLENRKYLDYIFQNIRHKYWVYGHYHTSITGSLEGIVYKCLGISEIYQLRGEL